MGKKLRELQEAEKAIEEEKRQLQEKKKKLQKQEEEQQKREKKQEEQRIKEKKRKDQEEEHLQADRAKAEEEKKQQSRQRKKEEEQRENRNKEQQPARYTAPPKELQISRSSMEVSFSEREDSDSERNSSSDESYPQERIHEGIIDIEQEEMPTGAQMRMRYALAEQRDIPERDRYIEKRRSALTVKIIADPKHLDELYEELIQEITYKAMAEMEKRGEIYLGIVTEHINHYLWKLIHTLPKGDEELWKICMKHPREYYHGIRIRDASQSIGLDFRKNFTTWK